MIFVHSKDSRSTVRLMGIPVQAEVESPRQCIHALLQITLKEP